jgi:hypothetical protein
MGLFRNKSKPEPAAVAPLTPVYPPLKLFAGCTRAAPTTLVLRSKIAWLKDVRCNMAGLTPGPEHDHGRGGDGPAARRGQRVEVEGGEACVGERWVLTPGISGADGTPLFALNNKHKSLRRAFTLDDGATQYALIERPNTASTFRTWGADAVKLTLVARLVGTVGDARTLTLVGSDAMDAATVTLDTGQVAAQITYSCWKEVLKNIHTVRERRQS